MVISGKHFGPKSTSPGAGSVSGGYGRVDDGGDWAQRYPGVDCAVTVAHTQMRCKTSVGTGADYAWRVNIGEQDSTVFTEVLASYAPPVVINFKGVGASAVPHGTWCCVFRVCCWAGEGAVQVSCRASHAPSYRGCLA